jgi:hypothetical protein
MAVSAAMRAKDRTPRHAIGFGLLPELDRTVTISMLVVPASAPFGIVSKTPT